MSWKWQAERVATGPLLIHQRKAPSAAADREVAIAGLAEILEGDCRKLAAGGPTSLSTDVAEHRHR